MMFVEGGSKLSMMLYGRSNAKFYGLIMMVMCGQHTSIIYIYIYITLLLQHTYSIQFH